MNKGVPPLRLEYNQQLLVQLPSTLLHVYSMNLHTSTNDARPRSHKEAMACPNVEKWREVEMWELMMLHKLKLAHFVPLSLGVRSLPSKWAYDIKRNGIFKA